MKSRREDELTSLEEDEIRLGLRSKPRTEEC